jgi:hypothetical protein
MRLIRGTSSTGRGRDPMSSLASALSQSNRSEFSKSPSSTGASTQPPLHATKRNLITRARRWFAKLVNAVPLAFARYLIAFFIGIAAILAWQSYSGTARETVARWSPRLGWLAPPAAPVVQTAPAPAPATTAGATIDQLKATSVALAVVRQSVDKLTAEISKLQASRQDTADKTSASPPSRRESRRL